MNGETTRDLLLILHACRIHLYVIQKSLVCPHFSICFLSSFSSAFCFFLIIDIVHDQIHCSVDTDFAALNTEVVA